MKRESLEGIDSDLNEKDISGKIIFQNFCDHNFMLPKLIFWFLTNFDKFLNRSFSAKMRYFLKGKVSIYFRRKINDN